MISLIIEPSWHRIFQDKLLKATSFIACLAQASHKAESEQFGAETHKAFFLKFRQFYELDFEDGLLCFIRDSAAINR